MLVTVSHHNLHVPLERLSYSPDSQSPGGLRGWRGGLVSSGGSGVLLDAEAVEEGPLVRGKLHADLAVYHREGISGDREGRKVRGIAGGN